MATGNCGSSGVRRIALFGGSFNPIHYGHLLLADQVREVLGLDRVVFMPAGVPPHKAQGQLASPSDRYTMVALAIAGHPAFDVSDVELRRSGPSYTVDTLEAVRAAGKGGDAPTIAAGDELYLVIGSETFLDLLSWKEPARVASLARLVVVPRAGIGFDPEGREAQKVLAEIGQPRFVRATGATLAAGVIIVEAISLPMSASDLRRRASRAHSLAYRVPEAVIAYIRARRLYQEEAAPRA
jgi:nicotinate-nucleotide adenylyltransferase